MRVALGVWLGHAETLLTANVKYSIGYVAMKVFGIPTGSQVSNLENLFSRQLPKLIIISFVNIDTFSGNYAKIPFNFKH